MKLTGIHIDGFGAWSGLTLSRLSPECTVFYGPNEAGKTTLLQFVRAMFYGFSSQRRSRYLPPFHGVEGFGPAGGSLSAITSHESVITIRRHESVEIVQGALTIEGVEGPFHGESCLERIRHGIDEPTFNNVFAVGLRELQELGTLTDLEASHWLYSLASGLDRVSLVEVLGELGSSRSRLWSIGERNSQVKELLGQREHLRSDIADLSGLSGRYKQLIADREHCERELSTLELQIAEHQKQHRIWEAASLVYETWQRRLDLDLQISALGAPPNWPADAIARMERIGGSLRELHQRARKLVKRRKILMAELREIQLNEPLWRQLPRIEALAEHESWIVAAENDLREAEAATRQWTDRQSVQYDQYRATVAGAGGAQQINDQTWMALRGPAARLQRYRARWKAANRKMAQQLDVAGKQRREIAQAATGVPADLVGAVAEAGQRVSQLRNRIQIDERLQQLNEKQADLEEQANDLLEKQVLPSPVVWGIGAVFVVGIALLLVGFFSLFFPGIFASSFVWPTLMGLLAVGAAVGTKYGIERSNALQLEECQNQLSLTQTQIEQVTTSKGQLDRSLLTKGGTAASDLANRLEAAEAELARLEALIPLEAQRKAAEQAIDEINAHGERTRRRYRRARRHWRAALLAAGLPEDLQPRQVQAMSGAGTSLAVVENRLADARSDLDRRRRELSALSHRIGQIFAAAGLTPASSEASEQLRQLRRELTAQESLNARRDAIRRKQRALRRHVIQIEERASRLRRRRKLLLQECGVADVATFHRRATEAARLAAVVDDRERAARDIASLLAGIVDEQAMSEILSTRTRDDVEAEVSASARRLEELRQSQRQFDQQRGQLIEKIRTITSDRRPAQKRFELAQVEQRLADAIQRWQSLGVVSTVLQEIKEDYERNRQPETLREASEYLSKLTGGRYQRVWTPIGKNTLLVADRENHSITVDSLSRGTREQLFLSLRLALVGLFARRGIRLPMVLDDVLVNFDMTRARAAARVLHDFAQEGHQLLIFTCHEHVAELFWAQGSDVRRLPIGYTGHDVPFKVKELPVQLEEPMPASTVPVVVEPVVEANTEVKTDLVVETESLEVTPPSVMHVQVVNPRPVVEVVSTTRSDGESLPKLRRFDPPHCVVRLSPIHRRFVPVEKAVEMDEDSEQQWLLGDGMWIQQTAEMPRSNVEQLVILPTKIPTRSPVIRVVREMNDAMTPIIVDSTPIADRWR